MGCTPLHHAATNGHTDSVLLLLKAGADMSIQNNSGFTAAQLAKKYGHTTLANLLIQQ